MVVKSEAKRVRHPAQRRDMMWETSCDRRSWCKRSAAASGSKVFDAPSTRSLWRFEVSRSATVTAMLDMPGGSQLKEPELLWDAVFI